MAVWKKWALKPVKTSRSFQRFATTAKSLNHLEAIVKKNKALKRAIGSLFNKTTAKLAVGATAVGIGVSYINEYIQSNSGCFIKSNDSVCKVKELSCCQPDKVENVPFCSLSPLPLPDPCQGFNEDTENTCCRYCNCNVNHCLPHQTMECRRPTIAEALSHYAQRWTTSFWQAITDMFPWLIWILSILGVVIAMWLGRKIYKMVRNESR